MYFEKIRKTFQDRRFQSVSVVSILSHTFSCLLLNQSFGVFLFVSKPFFLDFPVLELQFRPSKKWLKILWRSSFKWSSKNFKKNCNALHFFTLCISDIEGLILSFALICYQRPVLVMVSAKMIIVVAVYVRVTVLVGEATLALDHRSSFTLTWKRWHLGK